MPFPLAPAALAATGAHILVEAAVHPIRSWIGAEYAPKDLGARYNSWKNLPIVSPEPGALLNLYVRGMGDESWIRWALATQGINLRYSERGRNALGRWGLWEAVAESQRSVPGPEVWVQHAMRRWMEEQDAKEAMKRAGGDWDWWIRAVKLGQTRPSADAVFTAYMRGLIDDNDAPTMVLAAGGDWADFSAQRRLYKQYPSPADGIFLRNRGIIDDAGFDALMTSHGLGFPDVLPMMRALRDQVPGVSDLLRMASRQLFSPEIVGAYGLYSEFPESMRPWFAKLGLDYPVGFNLPAQDGGREATLPDLYWGITREILPLGAAYQAYQRLRPGAIARFQREVPDLKPFTIADLRYHMRVAGYPPPMRDYLIALSHPPLGRRQITQAVQYGGWDLQRTKDAYLDLGDTEDNALIEAEVALARKQAQEDAWKRAVERRAHTTTVSEIEGMYNEGIISRAQALSHLGAAGLSAELSTQLLDLADSGRSRGLLRAAVSATGRDYLSGALSAAEALSALGALGIVAARAGELMQIWTVRRSRHRRQASTAQIIRWVGLGRLPFAEGSRRLGNLGWSDPDQILLLADAQATQDKASAREHKLADQADAKRAREIERLAREAQAEHRRLIGEANRVAPRSVLMKWLRSGEMSQDDFRAALRARDFPEVDIDRYVEDALRPSPGKTRKVPPSGIYPRAPGSRHPALGMVEKMYLTEVISLAQFDQILTEMGYGDDDRRRLIAIADLKHGAKGTTEEPPAPAPSP